MISFKHILHALQSSCRPLEALQQAIDVYNTLDCSNPKETRSICSIAAEFNISHVTLSCRVRRAIMDRSQAHIHRQAVTGQEELALVNYISVLLASCPLPVSSKRLPSSSYRRVDYYAPLCY
jgi:hypothetical protein